MLPSCLSCQWLTPKSPNVIDCRQHTLSVVDPRSTFCCDFANDSTPQAVAALHRFNLDVKSLYLWIDRTEAGEPDLVALASIDTVKSWSIDEQRSMRAKRAELHRYFKQSTT
jgi:hypothetical protein